MLVAVLGRGKSLGRYEDRPWDKLYLVNNLSEESEIIGLHRDSAKEMIHIAGRKGATAMTSAVYARLGIRQVITNAQSCLLIDNWKRWETITPRSRPKMMNERGYPPIGWKKNLRGVKNAAKKSPNGRCWPTTGLFAIDLALTMERPEELFLYGIDCYRDDYLIKPNRTYQTQKNPKVKMMYVALERLVKEYPRTQFHCSSDLGIEAPNWNTLSSGSMSVG